MCLTKSILINKQDIVNECQLGHSQNAHVFRQQFCQRAVVLCLLKSEHDWCHDLTCWSHLVPDTIINTVIKNIASCIYRSRQDIDSTFIVIKYITKNMKNIRYLCLLWSKKSKKSNSKVDFWTSVSNW